MGGDRSSTGSGAPAETYEHFYLQNQAAACGLGVGLRTNFEEMS